MTVAYNCVERPRRS